MPNVKDTFVKSGRTIDFPHVSNRVLAFGMLAGTFATAVLIARQAGLLRTPPSARK